MLESWEVNAYNNLVDAVIECAVYDYFRACKTLQRGHRASYCAMSDARIVKKECEKFFRSEYCSWLLPDGGGPRLLIRLQRAVGSDTFRRAKYVTKLMMRGAIGR